MIMATSSARGATGREQSRQFARRQGVVCARPNETECRDAPFNTQTEEAKRVVADFEDREAADPIG